MIWFKKKDSLWIRDKLVFMERMVMINDVIASKIKEERYRASLTNDYSQLELLNQDMRQMSEMIHFIGESESKEDFLNNCRDDLLYYEKTYMN